MIRHPGNTPGPWTDVSDETDSLLCWWVEPWGTDLDASGRGVYIRCALSPASLTAAGRRADELPQSRPVGGVTGRAARVLTGQRPDGTLG